MAAPAAGHSEITRYQTGDGGHHWNVQWILRDRRTDNVRPYMYFTASHVNGRTAVASRQAKDV